MTIGMVGMNAMKMTGPMVDVVPVVVPLVLWTSWEVSACPAMQRIKRTFFLGYAFVATLVLTFD